VVGRVRNQTCEKDRQTMYGLAFTCEEIDYPRHHCGPETM